MNAGWVYTAIMLELVSLRREGRRQIRKGKRFDDSVLRPMESNLDIEEARLMKA